MKTEVPRSDFPHRLDVDSTAEKAYRFAPVLVFLIREVRSAKRDEIAKCRL